MAQEDILSIPIEMSTDSVESSEQCNELVDCSNMDSNSPARNYIADLVQKSCSAASSVAIKASEEIKHRIPASVNEKFTAKACELWSKLHSSPAPVSFNEFQVQLMNLYQEVLAGSVEIKRTLRDSRGEALRVRVRRVSEAAVLVSTKGLSAIVDFAEQKINVLLPEPMSESPLLADSFQISAESALAKVPEGLSRRFVALPLTVSFRVLRKVNLRGAELYVFLREASAIRVAQIATLSRDMKTRIQAPLARIPAISANLLEHAEEHIQLQVLREHANSCARRMVQLRRELFASMKAKSSAQIPESARKYWDNPNAVVEKLQERLMKIAAIAALVPRAERCVTISKEFAQKIRARGVDAFNRAVSFDMDSAKIYVVEKKNEFFILAIDKKNEVIAAVLEKKDKIVNSAVEKKNQIITSALDKKNEIVATAVARKDSLLKSASGVVQEHSQSIKQASESVTKVADFLLPNVLSGMVKNATALIVN